ncbi:hypothetical protein GGI12_005930, partial [Dipsacomyces acuminosporus]
SIRTKLDAGDLDAEFKQGKNFVNATIAEGVKHIVYSSLESPNLDIEEDFGNTVCLILDNRGQYRDKVVAA